MNIGCCGGRPVSLQGLIAQADALPASSRKGQAARMRLAYTVAAGRAAQVGNRAAYDRAMRGLRGLGDEGGSSVTPHGTATIIDPAVAAAQAEPISASLRSIINQAAPAASSTFRQVQSVVGILTGIARLGTGIAGLVPGADANAIRVINTVLSWISTLMNGTAPSIPTLDVATVQGLVGFCQFKDPIRGIIGAALGAAAAAITAAGAASGTVDAGALSALETITVWTDAILNGICNIPQIRIAAAAQVAAQSAAEIAARDAACRASSPMSRYDQTANKCQCLPGYRDRGSAAEGCYPIETSSSAPIMLTVEQRRAIIGGRLPALTPTQQRLLRPLLVTWTPGTLDPVTLCAPGEVGNPCNGGICDGGNYRGTTCVNGVPTKSSGLVLPLGIGAAALLLMFK